VQELEEEEEEEEEEGMNGRTRTSPPPADYPPLTIPLPTAVRIQVSMRRYIIAGSQSMTMVSSFNMRFVFKACCQSNLST
jgi:hypothetical protein